MNSPAIDIKKIILLAKAGNIHQEIEELNFPFPPVILDSENLNASTITDFDATSLIIVDLTSTTLPLSEYMEGKIQSLASSASAVILFHSDEELRSQLSNLQQSLGPVIDIACGGSDLECLMVSYNLDNLEGWYDYPFLKENDLSSMHCANFRFKTLKEASTLCELISNQCPDPQLTSIGLLELMINAVEHGNLEISYEEKSELLKEGRWQKEVEYRLSLDKFQDRIVLLNFVRKPNKIEVTITDEGSGFNAEKYLNPDKTESSQRNGAQYHGRGIAVASQLDFEKIEYFGVGNQVRVSIQTN